MEPNNEKKSKAISIDPKKKIIFSIILFLFPILFFALLEIGLRAFHYGQDYKLFTEINMYGKEYYKFNPESGKKYFYNLPSMSPSNDVFLKNKPKNGFRVFVIGCSTAAGFPYTSGVMFPRILQTRLQESYPDKHIEVVNAAMTAINSYSFQDRINEILDAKPDAVLIYGGHNEFYGALGIASKEALGTFRFLKILHLDLLDFKTYQLLRETIFGAKRLFSVGNKADAESIGTMMQKIAANKDIEYNSTLYKLAHEHFRKNMESILQKCNRKGVPVYFSELISNIRDLPPLGSSKSKNYPPASEVYQQGLDFEKAGDYEKAKTYLYRAKDLDCIHFRATEDLNSVIDDLSQKYGATLIPMKKIFEAKSPHGLIGNNLITEHLHPNIDGYFLMADAFYSAMINKQVIGRADPHFYKPSEYYRHNWGFTELDSLSVELNVQKIKSGWPFRPESEVNNFITQYKPKNLVDSVAYQAVRYSDITPVAAHKLLAKIYVAHNAPEKAVKEYMASLKIEPYNIENYTDAGNLLFQTGKYDQALEIWNQALKIDRDIYILSMIGETYSMLKDFPKAIPYLEEVIKTDPDFKKQAMLKLLYQAYSQTGNTAKANEILSNNRNLLSQDSPQNPKTEVIVRVSPQIGNLVKEAYKYLQAGNFDKGLELLYQANKIQESSLANRIIGEILLKKNDKNSLVYLKKVYRDYNSNAVYMNTLCYACIYFKDFGSAKKVLQELKQLAPNNPNIPNYEKMISGQ
jgi:tetratricopeptide (TPR) repeat protein